MGIFWMRAPQGRTVACWQSVSLEGSLYDPKEGNLQSRHRTAYQLYLEKFWNQIQPALNFSPPVMNSECVHREVTVPEPNIFHLWNGDSILRVGMRRPTAGKHTM